jgi:hypothetical protein
LLGGDARRRSPRTSSTAEGSSGRARFHSRRKAVGVRRSKSTPRRRGAWCVSRGRKNGRVALGSAVGSLRIPPPWRAGTLTAMRITRDEPRGPRRARAGTPATRRHGLRPRPKLAR